MQNHMNLRLAAFHRLPNEPLQNIELFERAWDECAELQVQEKHVWLGQAVYSLSQLDRYEIVVAHGDHVVGAVVLAGDPWDAHVGPCMSVFSQYVLPEYRNNGVSLRLMRECIRIARENDAGVLAYTHRTAPWRYSTTYRRI